MYDFLISVVSVVAVLGFMILIHEFGHYAVAKWLGVRVEQFAIGFGKRLVGLRKGETDYRINAIPLGGYVKMSGENPMDQRTDDPGEFMNHSRWHRFLIAIAGPTMNIVSASGHATPTIASMFEARQHTQTQSVGLEVRPSRQTFDSKLTPVLSRSDDPKAQRYRLGLVNTGVTTVSQLPFAQALRLSLD